MGTTRPTDYGPKDVHGSRRSKLYTYVPVSGETFRQIVSGRAHWGCGPRRYGVAALGIEGRRKGGGGALVEEPVGRRLGKRRRENAPAGSKKRRTVWVTAEEEVRLVARAARERVTVPNLLMSAALSESAETPTQRKAAMAELMALHTLLARVSNNVNQIARHANAGEDFPQDAAAVLGYVRQVAGRIDRTIEGLM